MNCLTDMNGSRHSRKIQINCFCYHAFCRLAVVIRHIKALLFEPFSYNIKRNFFDLNRVRRERVPKEVWLQNHAFSFARLKNHPMQQKSHTRCNGIARKMLPIVLKQIGGRAEAMRPSVSRIKGNTGKRLTRSEMVRFCNHLGNFDEKALGLFPNKVVSWPFGALSFRDEPKGESYTRRLILCARRCIHDQSYEAVRAEPHLHPLI